MKKFLNCILSLMVLLIGTSAFAAYSATSGVQQFRGMRIERYSKGGTFNMAKHHVVAPAVGHVNMTGQAQLVGYYPKRRSSKMIPRKDGQYKTYERKTVARQTQNKTRYRNTTNKTRYKRPAYRNKTLATN